jgi:hypothetical protein
MPSESPQQKFQVTNVAEQQVENARDILGIGANVLLTIRFSR